MTTSDSLGYVGDLRDALSQEALSELSQGAPVGLEGRFAAWHVAVALGRCRLFGADADDLDGTLPAEFAVAAVEAGIGLLDQWAPRAASVDEDWDDCDTPLERDEVVCRLLEFRMDVWAALVAIEEAQVALDEEGDPRSGRLLSLEETLVDDVIAFDASLRRQQEVLATIAELPLLDNWRARLAIPFSELLPWWLEGTLEQAAHTLHVEAVRSLPGADHWRRLAQPDSTSPVTRAPGPDSASASPFRQPLARRMAADTPPEGSVKRFRWRATNGRVFATLRLPPVMPLDPALRRATVRFFDDDAGGRGEAVGLFLTSVTLGGVAPLSLGESSAVFDWDALVAGDESLDLRVNGELWSVEAVP